LASYSLRIKRAAGKSLQSATELVKRIRRVMVSILFHGKLVAKMKAHLIINRHNYVCLARWLSLVRRY
jgi:hypothetical protein